MDVTERLWELIEPYVTAEGIELDDVEVLGGDAVRRVRIVVDGDVDVDRLADLSRGISRILDAEDPFPGSYTLEVTSPGLERVLRRPAHYRKALGREIKVKTTVAVAGEQVHRGVLREADDDGFVVETEGERRRIPYADVASARTVFVWERGGKPGKKASR